MTDALRLAAIDLGASSGRVMVGTVAGNRLSLEEVHRFPNGPVRAGSTLYWDILGIHREVLHGLKAAAARGEVHALGIDSWAVDYGLLDASGRLLGNPVCYRDSRTEGVMEQVLKTVPATELYDVTGLQQLPFNTIYQLVAERGSGGLTSAETMLMIPDLLGYWLTGSVGAEETNASTTQLYDVRARSWASDLAERVGVPTRLLPPLREAGSVVGSLLPEVAAEVGLAASTPVVAVGSHDTASAVVGVPATTGMSHAYISSGTWSLVGVELDEPVLTESARLGNFTNERGVDGTIRFLKNVMGLWVLSETLRTWGRSADLATLLAEAAEVPAFGTVVDIDAPELVAPGDMASRVARMCEATGQPLPGSPAAVVRTILESLALAYRRNVRLAAELSGRRVEVVHVVGGGARNQLLCQLTADACGLPVLAGPVEATALGNVLVQARALGADLPDLASMRALVASSHRPRRYEPFGSTAEWDAVEGRVHPGSVAG